MSPSYPSPSPSLQVPKHIETSSSFMIKHRTSYQISHAIATENTKKHAINTSSLALEDKGAKVNHDPTKKSCRTRRYQFFWIHWGISIHIQVQRITNIKVSFKLLLSPIFPSQIFFQSYNNTKELRISIRKRRHTYPSKSFRRQICGQELEGTNLKY